MGIRSEGMTKSQQTLAISHAMSATWQLSNSQVILSRILAGASARHPQQNPFHHRTEKVQEHQRSPKNLSVPFRNISESRETDNADNNKGQVK